MCKGILMKKNYTQVSRLCPNEQDWKRFDETGQDLIRMFETEKDGMRPNETKWNPTRPNETKRDQTRPNETCTTDYFSRSDSVLGLCLFLPQQYVI